MWNRFLWPRQHAVVFVVIAISIRSACASDALPRRASEKVEPNSLSPACAHRSEVKRYFFSSKRSAKVSSDLPEPPFWFNPCSEHSCKQPCSGHVHFKASLRQNGDVRKHSGSKEFPICVPKACSSTLDLATVAEDMHVRLDYFLMHAVSSADGSRPLTTLPCEVDMVLSINCAPWGGSVEANGDFVAKAKSTSAVAKCSSSGPRNLQEIVAVNNTFQTEREKRVRIDVVRPLFGKAVHSKRRDVVVATVDRHRAFDHSEDSILGAVDWRTACFEYLPVVLALVGISFATGTCWCGRHTLDQQAAVDNSRLHFQGDQFRDRARPVIAADQFSMPPHLQSERQRSFIEHEFSSSGVPARARYNDFCSRSECCPDDPHVKNMHSYKHYRQDEDLFQQPRRHPDSRFAPSLDFHEDEWRNHRSGQFGDYLDSRRQLVRQTCDSGSAWRQEDRYGSSHGAYAGSDLHAHHGRDPYRETQARMLHNGAIEV